MSKSIGDAIEEIFGGEPETVGVKHWLDTGYAPLNEALTSDPSRGLPAGRIVQMYGDSSSGKCVTEDTMLITDDGLLTLKEFFQVNGVEPVITEKNVEVTASLLNERFTMENTSHFTMNGRRKIAKITTNTGRSIKATCKHPLRVLSERGNIIWKNAGDIVEGDVLLTMIGTERYGEGGVSEDEAALIGYLVADGTMGKRNSVGFSNSDLDIESDFKALAKRVLGVEPEEWRIERKEHSKSVDHIISSTKLRTTLLEKYGLEYALAAQKSVPMCVRASDKEAQLRFLQAYFETDGFFNTSETLSFEVTSASRLLLDHVQLMLLNMGLIATVSEKVVKGYEHNEYFRLYLGGGQAGALADMLDFKSAAVRDKVARAERSSMDRDYNTMLPPLVGSLIRDLYDSVPSCSRTIEYRTPIYNTLLRRDAAVSHAKLRGFIDATVEIGEYNSMLVSQLEKLMDYNYETVTSAEILADKLPVFDVCLPETHSFWSNGFVSHNTVISVDLMIAAQKAGGLALFMDHERTFMKDLAEARGLDMTKGMFSLQYPRTFEESVTKAIKWARYIRDNKLVPITAPLVVVFDSLNSMVPQSKMEKEMDELKMNDKLALAASCSSVFPALAVLAEETDCLLLFLDQIRQDPGVMFGDNTKTSGGKAPGFYSSIRIALSRKVIKKDGEELGQSITAKIVKNKVGRPFRTAQWNFMFDDEGSGYLDRIGGMIDHLVEIGCIKKTGAYLEFGEKKVHRGPLVELLNKKENAYDELLAMLVKFRAKDLE